MIRIRLCQNCDRYTLGTTCKICENETIVNVPQKYSKDEEIAKYRRIIKKALLEKSTKNN
jgi:rRNA maturation protein Nop10